MARDRLDSDHAIPEHYADPAPTRFPDCDLVTSPAIATKPNGLLNALGLHRPELRAWAMYDWAVSTRVPLLATTVISLRSRSKRSIGSNHQ